MAEPRLRLASVFSLHRPNDSAPVVAFLGRRRASWRRLTITLRCEIRDQMNKYRCHRDTQSSRIVMQISHRCASIAQFGTFRSFVCVLTHEIAQSLITLKHLRRYFSKTFKIVTFIDSELPNLFDLFVRFFLLRSVRKETWQEGQRPIIGFRRTCVRFTRWSLRFKTSARCRQESRCSFLRE